MNLQESYYEIFGRNDLTDYRFHQLEEIMERAAANRSGALKKPTGWEAAGISPRIWRASCCIWTGSVKI